MNSQPETGRPDDERDTEQRETDLAEAEAREVGGHVEPLSEDPAEDAALEAGEGEAEGFEQAERRLEDVAGHGDEHRFPDRDVPPAEEAGSAESGEADEEAPPDA